MKITCETPGSVYYDVYLNGHHVLAREADPEEGWVEVVIRDEEGKLVPGERGAVLTARVSGDVQLRFNQARYQADQLRKVGT